jgi:hypothetical protein
VTGVTATPHPTHTYMHGAGDLCHPCHRTIPPTSATETESKDMTTTTTEPSSCAECGARLTTCQTKMWLGSRPCCDGCQHGQPFLEKRRE